MKPFFILGMMALGLRAFAHGEDTPGPHGGSIRMPGAFHTEVVAVGPHQVRIYLLDLNWKNPSLRDSKVEVTFDLGRKVKAKCVEQKEFYLCTFDKSVRLTSKGKLLVNAIREKQSGATVEYAMPLPANG